jgi:hypothetical protein
MDRNKIYEKKARLYPVIISMLIPLFLIICLGSKMMSLFYHLKEIWNIAISIIPATMISGALIYGVKNLARSTSKVLFQFPLFNEDESRMPTTEYLLWNNNSLSKQNKNLIREKIKSDFNLVLMNEKQEKSNEKEARLIIADAVKRIRERVRENQILFNYNCNYGFIRNFMGANIWSFFLVLILGAINYFNIQLDNRLFIGASTIILLSYPIAFYMLRVTSKEYASQLFTVYLEIQ